MSLLQFCPSVLSVARKNESYIRKKGIDLSVCRYMLYTLWETEAVFSNCLETNCS